MNILEKLKLFAEGFVEGWNENVAPDDEVSDPEFFEFENEFNTGIADPTPSYFDIGNLEHQFYHPHHPVYSK